MKLSELLEIVDDGSFFLMDGGAVAFSEEDDGLWIPEFGTAAYDSEVKVSPEGGFTIHFNGGPVYFDGYFPAARNLDPSAATDKKSAGFF